MYIPTRFPDNISRGAVGGPGYATDIAVTGSGREQRLVRRPIALCTFDVAHGIRTQAQLDTLVAFFRIADGRANTFPFRDWSDYRVTQATGKLGSGNGSGEPLYQLEKHYTVGALVKRRVIIKPGAVVVHKNGTPVPVGIGPGEILSINTSLGLVTFAPDATASPTNIITGATTSVDLFDNPGSLVAGQRLYLSGFDGADASLVNDRSHEIISVTGFMGGPFPPFTFVLATNTSGATITLGDSSMGARYPQLADALTWVGTFDLKCRFDTDIMRTTMETKDRFTWGQIPVTEQLPDEDDE
jgi:uncharacterized protein (TIGR02217 family)